MSRRATGAKRDGRRDGTATGASPLRLNDWCAKTPENVRIFRSAAEQAVPYTRYLRAPLAWPSQSTSQPSPPSGQPIAPVVPVPQQAVRQANASTKAAVSDNTDKEAAVSFQTGRVIGHVQVDRLTRTPLPRPKKVLTLKAPQVRHVAQSFKPREPARTTEEAQGHAGRYVKEPTIREKNSSHRQHADFSSLEFMHPAFGPIALERPAKCVVQDSASQCRKPLVEGANVGAYPPFSKAHVSQASAAQKLQGMGLRYGAQSRVTTETTAGTATGRQTVQAVPNTRETPHCGRGRPVVHENNTFENSLKGVTLRGEGRHHQRQPRVDRIGQHNYLQQPRSCNGQQQPQQPPTYESLAMSGVKATETHADIEHDQLGPSLAAWINLERRIRAATGHSYQLVLFEPPIASEDADKINSCMRHSLNEASVFTALETLLKRVK